MSPKSETMGMEVPLSTSDEEQLKCRPSILLVGAPDVGKRSILNRILANGRAAFSSTNGVTCHRWTLDTKYYTANLCIWMSELNEMRVEALTKQSDALVMVFDLSNAVSFESLQKWVLGVDLTAFEILLCVGNKVDCVPKHYGHAEYRRKLQRRGESSSDPHPEFSEFGIHESEGSGLLVVESDEEKENAEKKRSRVEWCIDHGIEYIEVCAINKEFDECLSVDGDLQGVSRIVGALSAHMWEGMVMKPLSSQNSVTHAHTHTHTHAHSDDWWSDDDNDSDFTIEYELLSQEEEEKEEEDSVEDSATAQDSVIDSPIAQIPTATRDDVAAQDSAIDSADKKEKGSREGEGGGDGGMEHVERFMMEIASMRENMSMMSDAQRRESAAAIAMRMASMLRDDDDDDDA